VKDGDAVQGVTPLTDEVLANLEFLELDGLVIISGDDTLSYGAVLAAAVM
jgi:ATP-dependent phosphofructokinase / diphosphate-dependent phosphofructokinase